MIPFDLEAVREDLLEIVFQSEVKLTPLAYIRKIKSRVSVSFIEAKNILKHLVQEQSLTYQYLYGTTYVEKSFLKPVGITPHYTLTPPGFEKHSNTGAIDIIIEPGLSFGSGQHPTTQLCLQAIEFCLYKKKIVQDRQKSPAADIGTGSGVLAIALCLSGVSSCDAFEIDPVSISEAQRNIVLNHLSEDVRIREHPFEARKNRYAVICANLRFPTLAALSGAISSSLIPNGIAILSGVREWEKQALLPAFKKKGLDPVWQKDEKKWSAFVLIKKI